MDFLINTEYQEYKNMSNRTPGKMLLHYDSRQRL